MARGTKEVEETQVSEVEETQETGPVYEIGDDGQLIIVKP